LPKANSIEQVVGKGFKQLESNNGNNRNFESRLGIGGEGIITKVECLDG